MGGETVNIGQMAEKVSKDIFSRFGWRLTGPMNENFTCVKPDIHQKKSNPTHPVDAVFEYDDPYTGQRQYLLTDFKSYAKGSIGSGSTRDALVNLSKAVDCANVSSEWQEKYTNSEINWDVHGFLFVFNHDGKFDSYFNKYLRDTRPSSLHLPPSSRIHVIGPDRISFLLNMINDIDVMRGQGVLPPSSTIDIWYPDLVSRAVTNKISRIASIEILMGPWVILPYEKTEIDSVKISKGLYIYYEGQGRTPQEFEFLMDFAFKNELVQKNCEISIRCPNSESLARQHFEQAQENIFRHFRSFEEVKNRLNQFSFTPIDIVKTRFSSEEVGMEARNG